MKLCRVVSFYPEFVPYFYSQHPGLEAKSYAEQAQAVHDFGFAAAGCWTNPLRDLGVNVVEIYSGIRPIQSAWLAERGLPLDTKTEEILLRQIEAIDADMIFLTVSDPSLILSLRSRLKKGVKLFGWCGSAIGNVKRFKGMDFMMSCAPEAVERLTAAGLTSFHMHHAFDRRQAVATSNRLEKASVAFVGSIVRGDEFHDDREKLLLALQDKLDVEIYSHVSPWSARREAKLLVKTILYRTLSSSTLKFVPKDKPQRPVSPQLARRCRPPVFGRDLYAVIRQHAVNLNIHANSSPRHASNMRMFEITGGGGCLLTDWRPNLDELFAANEVVAYRNAAECLEKARWLLANPEARATFRNRGHERTLRDHCYENRAPIFLDIMNRGRDLS